MCNKNCECKTCESCISDILRVILVLQQNACPENALESCDRPMLSCGPRALVCNTRPIMLYTCSGNGVPWSMTTTTNPDCTNTDQTSCVFRIEKMDGCCVTLRVLRSSIEDLSQFVATDSFFTIDLKCICAIKCLTDTFIECI